MIQAVIFDLDGTIVDSNDAHVCAWDEAFSRFGKSFSREQLYRQVGKGADQYLPAFLNDSELRSIGPKIAESHTAIFKEKYLSQIQPFPRVRDLFRRITEDGKRIALASSGKKEEVAGYKKKAGIEDLIDVEITADDADKSKPAPDIFVAALHKLGDPPLQSVLTVGDTPYDIAAAKKAGLATIGVICGGFSETDLRSAGAIAIYRDPADLLERYDASPVRA
jgi:HAD superfamily hydrolase (TIGR01509 family)